MHLIHPFIRQAKKIIFTFYAILEMRRSSVVRAAWLWCRESPEVREFEAGFAIRRLESFLCHPTVNGYFFSNQRRIRQQKEGDGLCLSFAVLKIAPNVPTAIRQWETFIFTYYAKTKFRKLYTVRWPKWLTFHFHSTSQFRILKSEF